MLNNFNSLQEEEGYDGDFMAIVVDNADPLFLHRIRVTVPGILEADDPTALPWALPKSLTTFGNDQVLNTSTKQSFSINVPAIGSRVYIYFQKGDPHFPVYAGSAVIDGSLTNNPTYSSDELMVNYPRRRGWRDQAQNLFYADATSGSQDVEFVHKSTARVKFSDDGTILISGVGGLGKITIQPSGAIDIVSSNGDINITSGGDLNLSASSAIKIVSGTDIELTASNSIKLVAPSISLN